MKRNQIVVLITILSMLSLTGCMDVGDLTDEQSDLIAEYSAGVLLRYSESYERRLITKEQLKKQGIEEVSEGITTPTPSAVVTATPQTPDDTTQTAAKPDTTEVPELSVNDFYQLDGVKVSYDSYQFGKKYGNSQIRAADGETLLVVSFLLTNVSGKTKKLNLMKRMDISYTLDADGNQYLPGPSILENGGLNQLSTTLKPGQKEKAVLIYRMSKERKNASSIILTIADESKQAKVTLR